MRQYLDEENTSSFIKFITIPLVIGFILIASLGTCVVFGYPSDKKEIIKPVNLAIEEKETNIFEYDDFTCEKVSNFNKEGVEFFQINIIKYNGTITEVNIPEKINKMEVCSLGDECFYRSDITSVSIPKTVTRFGNYCFYECRKLNYIKFYASASEELVIVGDSAFYGCSSLSNVEFKYKNLKLGANSFSDCPALETVSFNSQCRLSIGACAFRNSGLKVVILPQKTTDINVYAFSNCYKLKNLNIPESCETKANITKKDKRNSSNNYTKPIIKPSESTTVITPTTVPSSDQTLTTQPGKTPNKRSPFGKLFDVIDNIIS